MNFYSSDLFKLPENLFVNDSYTGDDADKKLWNTLVDKCMIERNRSGDVIFSLANFKFPLKELMYQNYLYNEQGEDIYFMEIALKTKSNYVTQIDKVLQPIPQKELGKYIVNLRAYSITRNIWIKDYQPLKSLVLALQKEKYITKNAYLIYYNMIRDACVLLAYRVKFSDNAKTKEVRKMGRVDIKDLLDPRRRKIAMQKFQEEQVVDTYLHKEQLAEKDKKPDQDDKFGQVLEPGGIRGGLKDIETKEVDLSRILFQMIISINPMQMATVLYNDVSDEFLYRIYRPKDGSVYEKTISSDEINCHPVYKQCIEQGKFKEVGERVAKHYLNEIMIESVLEFSNLI